MASRGYTPKKRLEKVVEVLNRTHSSMNIRLRESKRGVPHIVGDVPFKESFSITYFGMTGTFVMFYPWPSHGRKQRRFKMSHSQPLGVMRDAIDSLMLS